MRSPSRATLAQGHPSAGRVLPGAAAARRGFPDLRAVCRSEPSASGSRGDPGGARQTRRIWFVSGLNRMVFICRTPVGRTL
jgi:hypothetical protein